ncbi:cysteinyl-tRNA synthetase [Albimonas donghaensis]|uniref:Cysteine--tRNA ligase n=1 Tax=Albimonas donghaensis TaxID=356660 RepID=A0A1H2T7U0_9RHOB|nr:cysteine--tRNA ligase [Albimonas donghaensis]SDW39961.1 cysteinyl-tRNA synthetase [Albimonas donghaensis]
MTAPIQDSHPIRLRNSATGELAAFIPRDWRAEPAIPAADRRVGVYLCGPTVYDRAHIGNARPAVVFDVLRRLLALTYPGQVRFVRNFTDVEDKINDRAAERFPDLAPLDAIARVTEETIAWYHEDMAALGVAIPDDEPRATAYVPEMVAMIETLVARGHAYEAEGHVLFDVGSFPGYGALSGRDTEDMIAGARVEVAPYKKHPMDFVLWKPSTETQPGWPSPWGRGRPGWHIECSAMAKALLGTDFDIHGGGSDLLFPHHENERAQSCCADPDHGFAEVWMHNGMIRVDGRKMSKSLGNFFTVHDKRAEMSGDVIRYILLNAHYRDELDWTEDRVEQARAALNRLNRLADRYRRAGMVAPDPLVPHASVLERLRDDLDTHGALAALHALASEAINPAETDIETLRPAVETARWLGFALETAADGDGDDARIDAACARLDAARADRNYAEADRIRAALDAAGLIVQTTKAGTTAERGAGFDRTRLEDLT